MKTCETLIVGGGPAGVTAAMYTARANFKTIILSKDQGALGKADKVDNYYGHLEISGKDLYKNGITQAKNFGAEVINCQALGIYVTDENKIIVETNNKKEIETKTVVFATGASRKTPKIKGLDILEGRGVSYCAVCDGFFHRGKNVAVLGNQEYALHEANDLLPIAGTVTLLTNGEEVLADFPKNVIIHKGKIKEVLATKTLLGPVLSGVVLEDASVIELSGLFIAVGIAGGTELARKIGGAVESNAIVVDSNMNTSIPGFWAAGDCTGGLKQIAKAIHEGAIAGTNIVRYLREGN